MFTSSANILHQLVKQFGKSFMYIANKIGPRRLPSGIPLIILDLFQQDVPTFTHQQSIDKKQEIHLYNFLVMP